MTLKELRALAKEKHISNWWNKNTAQLTEELKLNDEAKEQVPVPEQTPKKKYQNRRPLDQKLSEYCRANDLPYYTVYDRLFRLGWDEERALNTPVRKKNKHD